MTESREEKGKGKRDRLRVSEWERKNRGRGRQAKARMAKKPFIIRARFFLFSENHSVSAYVHVVHLSLLNR